MTELPLGCRFVLRSLCALPVEVRVRLTIILSIENTLGKRLVCMLRVDTRLMADHLMCVEMRVSFFTKAPKGSSWASFSIEKNCGFPQFCKVA